MDWKVTVFSYLLLLRKPAAFELDDIRAALRALRRTVTLWVLVYAAWCAATIAPQLLRDRSTAYYVTAILVPNFLFWGVASTAARAWIGYRYYEVYPKAKRNMMFVSLAVGGLVGAFIAIFGNRPLGEVVRTWMSDAFGSPWWLIALLMLLSVWPELIAKLRLRERKQIERASAAEAASEKLARATAESELRLLQAQVEPHFLYNTLANLRYLIQKGSDEALKMTDTLIEYLRTSVPDMRANRVTLGREADHVRHYLDIMQMRMAGRLRFSVDVPEALRAIELPPLVLLTLVENAIKHGVGPEIDGGEVRVAAFEDGDRVRVEVRDSGTGRRREEVVAGAPSTGAGLANARGRLGLTYGDAASLTLTDNVPRGTVATVRIPREMPRSGDEPRPKVLVMSTERAAGMMNDLVPDLLPTPPEVAPVRHRGPRKQWSTRHDGRDIRVVDSWFGGAELFVDDTLRATFTQCWKLPPEEPVMTAFARGSSGAPLKIDVVLQAWSFSIRAAILVNGSRIAGDAI
jgi:signal transduction histidine kinase